MKSLVKDFAGDGYRFPDLLRRIATSEAFYRVAPPQTGMAAPAGTTLAAGGEGVR
jgi:hypothetical protein